MKPGSLVLKQKTNLLNLATYTLKSGFNQRAPFHEAELACLSNQEVSIISWFKKSWLFGGVESLVGNYEFSLCSFCSVAHNYLHGSDTLFIWQCTQYCFARENCTKQAQCISIFIVYWAESLFTWSHPLFNPGPHVPFPVQPVFVVSIAGLTKRMFLWFWVFFCVDQCVKICRT